MWNFIKKEWAQLSTKSGALLGLLALVWPFVQGDLPGLVQGIADSHPIIAHWLNIAIGAIGASLIAYREKPKNG